MMTLEQLTANYAARRILAEAATRLPRGWAARGSQLDRAREVLDNATRYLERQVTASKETK